MLILRIRRAECALADGRLDEAFDQAVRDDVRQHRRGQSLVTRLINKLIERGKSHFDVGRADKALEDYERAERLGGNQAQLVQLRDDASSLLKANQREQQRQEQLLQAARNQVAHGQLTLGAKLVDQLKTEGASARGLEKEIAFKHETVENALGHVRQAIAQEAYDDAVRDLLQVRRIQPTNPHLAQCTEQILGTVHKKARQHMEGGRLDAAESLLRQVSSIANGNFNIRDLTKATHELRQVRDKLNSGDFHGASQLIKQLRQRLPNAKWLRENAALAKQIAEALETLNSGPLSLLESRPPSHEAAARGTAHETFLQGQPRPIQAAAVQAGPVHEQPTLPERFLLRIDGVGSHLVVYRPKTTIGPDSSSHPPDIALLASPNTPKIRIQRLEDDYFLHADRKVQVNGNTASRKLLSHGDKITLGRRCQLRFELPNAASATALIDLSNARMPRNDVNKVVLLDESIVIGPGKSAHIQARDLPHSVVLHVRGDQLLMRRAPSHQDDNASRHEAVPLAMGRAQTIGSTALVVTPV